MTMTLPPVLYWSRSLAERLNSQCGTDERHGLIDATVATVPLVWTADGDRWAVWPDLPADAVQLVAPPVEIKRLRARVAELEAGEIRTEWGVRYSDGVVGAPAPNAEAVSRRIAERADKRLMRREVRTGSWIDAS